MVSFQPISLGPNPRKPIPELENSSNKRKRSEEEMIEVEEIKRSRSIFDVELHLETPLPLGWQRCLDIQSGQIHFYNTRTNKKTSRDPRRSPDPDPQPSSPVDHHTFLDLDLNLSCDSLKNSNGRSTESKKLQGGTLPSWLSVEEEQQEQMVATVCTRCHMLVMLFKSSPACPNCKFMHRPEEGNEPKVFEQCLSLLC